MSFQSEPSTAHIVANGSVATIMTVIARDTLYATIPWLLLAAMVIILDLYYGVKAAKKRGEIVRTSRAIRRTFAKAFEYLCWTIMACALTVIFQQSWIDEVIIAVILAIESISLVGNALYCKGYQVKGLEDFAVKFIGKKIDADTSDIVITKNTNQKQTKQ